VEVEERAGDEESRREGVARFGLEFVRMKEKFLYMCVFYSRV
jgi:hypothetical protein